MRACAACSIFAPDSEATCPKCGQAMASDTTPTPGSALTKQCQFCKLRVPSEATVCGHCGKGIGTVHTVAAFIQFFAALFALFLLWPLLSQIVHVFTK